MIYIISDENNLHLFDDITHTLQVSGYTVKPPVDSSLEAQAIDYVRLHESNAMVHIAVAQSITPQSNSLNNSDTPCWILNVLERELIAPSGESTYLSRNECSLLSVVVNAKRKIISRRALVEAMGYDYLQYDERCLEAIISRLRRKVFNKKFTVRAIKGYGYLFDVEIEKAAD